MIAMVKFRQQAAIHGVEVCFARRRQKAISLATMGWLSPYLRWLFWLLDTQEKANQIFPYTQTQGSSGP